MRVQNFKENVTVAGGNVLPFPIQHIQNFMTVSNSIDEKTKVMKRKVKFDKDNCIQNFMNSVKEVEKKNSEIQFGTALTDYPDYLVDLMKTLETDTYFDNGYEMFYDTVPVDGDGYDIFLEEYDISFKNTPPGDTVLYGGSSGTKYRVYLEWYSGGHGVDRRLIIAKKFYQIAKDAANLRTAAFVKKAQIAYALIEAIPTSRNIAYQAPKPSTLSTASDKYIWNRIAVTIKTGIEQLIADNIEGDNWKKTVAPAGLSTTFHILAPYQLMDDITGAINYKFQDQGNAGNPTSIQSYNIQVHKTTMLTDPTKFYIIIPGGQMTSGNLLNYTPFSEFNKDTFMDSTAAWMSYVYHIGDTEQLVRCATTT
jgi:hypothetical protein